MSIRGRGPHTVVIQPRKITRAHGARQYVNDGPPIEVKHCSVQSVREWATAEEVLTHGLQLISMRRVFSRVWHGDVNALVYFDGGEFELVGDPQFMDQSRRTLHWVTTIRWLGNAEAPSLAPDPDPAEGPDPEPEPDPGDDEEVPDGNS